MFTSITQPSLIRTATKSIALVTPRRSFRPTIAWANRDPTHQSPPDKSVGGSEQLIDDTSVSLDPFLAIVFSLRDWLNNREMTLQRVRGRMIQSVLGQIKVLTK